MVTQGVASTACKLQATQCRSEKAQQVNRWKDLFARTARGEKNGKKRKTHKAIMRGSH